jgi:hypothetical protein
MTRHPEPAKRRRISVHDRLRRRERLFAVFAAQSDGVIRSRRSGEGSLFTNDCGDERLFAAATLGVIRPRRILLPVIGPTDRPHPEDQDAAAICDELLTGPPSWWPTRLRQRPEAFTAGMVRTLLDRMRATIESSPEHALRITALAAEIADELDASDSVMKLRGQACRDRAYVLALLGPAREALDVAAHARRLFAQVVPLPDSDLALLDVVDAAILVRLDRVAHALDHARRAGETFLRLGDRTRFLVARTHEAAILFNSRRPRHALDVWSAIDGDPGLGDVLQVRLRHNIALCHLELGRPELAAPLLECCAAGFEALGMETERTRSRWCHAEALAASGRSHEAIPALRQTRKELEGLGLVMESGLAALELAGQLLTGGETADVAAICRDLVVKFTQAAMPSRTITVLLFLREALTIGVATPDLIGHVHAARRYLSLDSDPRRVVASPPLPQSPG